MNDLNQQTSQTVRNIERYERNWHLAKAILLTAGVIAIISVQIVTFHKLLDNSNANRHLLHCTVTAINTNDFQHDHNLITKCLQADK